MSNIVVLPVKYREHHKTDAMRDSWLSCVPYFAQLKRIEYRCKHHRLLGAPKDE